MTAAGLTAPLWTTRTDAAVGGRPAGEPHVIGASATGPDIHGAATPAAIPPGPFQLTCRGLLASQAVQPSQQTLLELEAGAEYKTGGKGQATLVLLQSPEGARALSHPMLK